MTEKTAPIRVGQPAPDFELPNHEGRRVRLSEYRGRHAVVVYFYPRDFTLICTREACAFRDEFDAFRGADAVVLGVSSDSPQRHARFSERHHLPFQLLSDPDNAVRRRWRPRGPLGRLADRFTYVLDRGGTVRYRYVARLRGRRHVENALAALERLRAQGPEKPL